MFTRAPIIAATPAALFGALALASCGSVVDTGGAVRATQTFTGGPSFEAGSVNALSNGGSYSLTLPAGAPVRLPYASAATMFPWVADPPRAGVYRLEATASRFAAPKPADITLSAPMSQSFSFP